jgi:hypothetical protein
MTAGRIAVNALAVFTRLHLVPGHTLFLSDLGAGRALAGRLPEPLDGLERELLLETWVACV